MGTAIKTDKKLTLVPLILMIFTSVFGFTNMPRSFFLMGYGAIPWYVLSALAFFIPYAFMMAEYGAAFKNEKGGIYSWMEKSVGPKYAFIGTFMWYASYVVWMVNICSSIWIVFSTAVFGKDLTPTWQILGLNSTQTIGLMGVALMVIITYTATKGLDKITKVTSLGGTAVTLINVVLLVGAIIIFFANGGQLAEPFSLTSPNPSYQTPMSMASFMVFAIFAFGGIEVIGGLVDKTENPEKTFPKGVTIAAIVIAVGYSVGIFLCGIATNWDTVLSGEGIHMGNVAYILMENLGYVLGNSLGMSDSGAATMGLWMSRYMGISMVLALMGAFFTLCYSPLKQLIEGTPSEMWPEKVKTMKNGMPVGAMWLQCITVVIFILLVSFGGEGASEFFSKLILMTNVAMTLPYMFVAGAFPAFKKNKGIEKPFEIYKNQGAAKIATAFTIVAVAFANISTIIEPATKGDMASTIWMVAGPLFFTVVSLSLYSRYEKKTAAEKKEKVA